MVKAVDESYYSCLQWKHPIYFGDDSVDTIINVLDLDSANNIV